MKLLKDIGLFSRLPIFLSSKMVMAQIHYSFYFRHVIKAAQSGRMDYAFTVPENQKHKKLFYDFQKPHFLYNWVITNDKEIGGESEGNVYYNEDHLYMKGSLVEERSDLLLQRMYYGISSRFFTRLNLVDYNGMRIRIKTDGNLYKVLLSMSSYYEVHHQACAFIIDTSKEWQTLEKQLTADLGKFILRGLAIVIESEKAIDFELSVGKIEVIYNPEFEDLVKIYKRPFFFYAQNSYKDVKEINTGKEKLVFQNSKSQENKKTVNDLFEEGVPTQEYEMARPNKPIKETKEEVKPVSILKERLSKKINNK